MRHVIIERPGHVVVAEAPDPVPPGPDGAVVAVDVAAICGSDLHFYDGDLDLHMAVPVGHEFVGTVVDVGPEVRRIRIGDRVLCASVAGCGRCDGCATGDPARCVDGPKIFGSGMLPAGQATAVAVPAADFQLLVVPDGIDDEAALLLTDNLCTGWAGAERSDLAPGGTVVVLGLGAVGQCAVRSALAQGAGRVLVADPVGGRRDRAVAHGAEELIGPPVEAVLEATGGRGADAVIDAVATDASLDAATAMVRAAGTISVIGVHDPTPFPMPALGALLRSLTFRFTVAPVHRTWAALVPLVKSGALDTNGIFTHEFALDDAAEAYRIVAGRSPECMKVLLRP